MTSESDSRPWVECNGTGYVRTLLESCNKNGDQQTGALVGAQGGVCYAV